jgi:hypothetical protein
LRAVPASLAEVLDHGLLSDRTTFGEVQL